MSQRDWDDSEQENDDARNEPQPPLEADAASPEDLDESGETLHPEDWDPANDVAEEEAPRHSEFVEMLWDTVVGWGMLLAWLCRPLSPIRKLPIPLLALLLIAPALAISFANPWADWWKYVGIASTAAALLLPGAIKRGKWSHVLWMLLFGLVSLCLLTGWRLLSVELRFPYGWLTSLLMLLPLAAGEWLLTGRERGRAVQYYLASAAAVVFVYELADLLRALSTEWDAKWQLTPAVLMAGGFLAFWALLSAAGSQRPLVAKGLPIAAAATTILGFVIFAEVLLVPLGRASLCGQGPFTRMAGMEVCLIRKDSNAIELGFRELERIDWNVDLSAEWRDWRRSFLKQFYEKHPDEAAERGSRILLAHPTGLCTRAFAAIMAERRREETYPIMLWYSLAGCFNIANAGHENVEAVLSLDFPHVAYLVLYRELADWERPRHGEYGEMTIRDNARKRLFALLGHDAGADGNEWDRQLPTWVSERTTSLSPQRVEDLNKVASLLTKCVTAKAEAKKFVKRGAFVRMVADGNLAEAKWVAQKRENLETSQTVEEMLSQEDEKLDTSQTVEERGRKVASAVSAFLRATRLVEKELGTTVEWNNPGMEGLEEAVSGYLKRMDAFIRRYSVPLDQLAPPTTGPATHAVRPAVTSAPP